MVPQSRYCILTGNYGSGKTELALALARHYRKTCAGRIALVDLDIVNPYFRSAEHKALLESEGIEVLMPSFAMSTVDIPSLPAAIQGVFAQEYAHVIIDLGGDDTGATALGRYAPDLAPLKDQIAMLYVVNPFRPLSGTAEDIVTLFTLIERRARFRPTQLVNNANLQEWTTAQDLVAGQAVLEEVSLRLSLPIGMVVGQEPLRKDLPPALQDLFFPISPLMKPDWLVEGP